MALVRKNVSTEKDEWATPGWLFDFLNDEVKRLYHEDGFGLDAAAQINNAKCEHYLHHSSLECDWQFQSHGKPIFLNPPHSKGNIDNFMKKAYEESLKGAIVYCLVPVSSDVDWWHKYVMGAQIIRFIKRRVDYVGFDLEGKQIKQSPTFPSCVVIFDKRLGNTRNAELPCGLDDPCDEGLVLPEGETCSMGFIMCEDDPVPRIGKTIEKPKKVKNDSS